jgi:hypothetical protein
MVTGEERGSLATGRREEHRQQGGDAYTGSREERETLAAEW